MVSNKQVSKNVSKNLDVFVDKIKTNPRLGVINVVSRLIVAQVENVSPEVKKELNSYEVKFELYKKVLWLVVDYILNKKGSHGESITKQVKAISNPSDLVQKIREETKKNPYFCLDFIEGAFSVLRDLLPESQKTHKFVPSLNTATKEMTLPEKREMAAKILNLLEGESKPNPILSSGVNAKNLSVAENRDELDQSLLYFITQKSKKSPNFLAISTSLANIAGLITGDLDPNDLIPDFIPISDKTRVSLLVDVLISETNKLRHLLPGKTIGLKEFD